MARAQVPAKPTRVEQIPGIADPQPRARWPHAYHGPAR